MSRDFLSSINFGEDIIILVPNLCKLTATEYKVVDCRVTVKSTYEGGWHVMVNPVDTSRVPAPTRWFSSRSFVRS